jgi:hypothetical protein
MRHSSPWMARHALTRALLMVKPTLAQPSSTKCHLVATTVTTRVLFTTSQRGAVLTVKWADMQPTATLLESALFVTQERMLNLREALVVPAVGGGPLPQLLRGELYPKMHVTMTVPLDSMTDQEVCLQFARYATLAHIVAPRPSSAPTVLLAQ